MLAPALDGTHAPKRVELTGVPFFAQDEYQCGPAALATVLAYSGLDITPQELAPRVYLPGRKGSLQLELIAAARRYGRIPYAIRPTLPALAAELQAGRPAVVFQNLGLASVPVWHFAVMIGYSEADDLVLLRSGRDERREMSAYNFVRTWELGGRWALVALRPGELPVTDDPEGYLRAVAAAEEVLEPAALTEAYRAAVQRWPDDAIARFGLGNALRASGAVAAAVAEYRTLLSAHPGDRAALNNLADALNLLGCGDAALAAVDAALAASGPGDPLRAVMAQTRQEILAAPRTGSAPPAACRE